MVAHFWRQSSWVYSMDCDVSITFQPFLPGLVCSSLGLSSTCSIPGQAGLWTGIAMPIFFATRVVSLLVSMSGGMYSASQEKHSNKQSRGQRSRAR